MLEPSWFEEHYRELDEIAEEAQSLGLSSTELDTINGLIQEVRINCTELDAIRNDLVQEVRKGVTSDEGDLIQGLRMGVASPVEAVPPDYSWVTSPAEMPTAFDEAVRPTLSGVTFPEIINTARASLYSQLPTDALVMEKFQQQMEGMRAEARGPLKKALNWFLKHLFSDISAVAGSLSIDSWTVQVSAGFPSGLSCAISLTFK